MTSHTSGSAPRVSVVVPAHDAPELLDRCLASLERQHFPAVEVIVVDDGSSRPLAARGYRTIVTLPARQGFAAAANAGAAASRGAFVGFVNSDVEVEPEWLGELVACAERHARAAVVTGKILRARDPRVLDGAGDGITRALKAYRRGEGSRENGRFDDERQIFSASGTACLWRADAFRVLGGFDERFVLYYEDVDLGFRARRRGWECWYTPTARAVHVGGGSTAPWRRELDETYALRNRWATVAKNAPREWLLRNAPLIVAAEASSLARACVTGDLVRALRGYRAVVASRRELAAARRHEVALATVGYDGLREFAERPFPPLRASLDRLRSRLDGSRKGP
jgi:GT2 family glycosyltransferase